MEVGTFPLFCHLKNEIGGEEEKMEELTPAQMTDLVEKVKLLDDQGCSLIYALIRYYQIYEEKQNAMEVPFNMKKIKNGHRFCVEDLPILLQHLLYCFVKIHLKSQNERNPLG